MLRKRETSWKKSIKLKGLRVPKFIIYFLGRMNAKGGKIKIGENRIPDSAWLRRKNKDFISYSAQLRDETKKVNHDIKKQIMYQKSEFKKIEELLEKYKKTDSISKTTLKPKKKHLREERRRLEILQMGVDKKKEIIVQVEVLIEDIDLSEHETEQMLLDSRSKLESVITVYLQGASKQIDLTYITGQVLGEERESANIYKSHGLLVENLKQSLALMEGLTYEKT